MHLCTGIYTEPTRSIAGTLGCLLIVVQDLYCIVLQDITYRGVAFLAANAVIGTGVGTSLAEIDWIVLRYLWDRTKDSVNKDSAFLQLPGILVVDRLQHLSPTAS